MPFAMAGAMAQRPPRNEMNHEIKSESRKGCERKGTQGNVVRCKKIDYLKSSYSSLKASPQSTV